MMKETKKIKAKKSKRIKSAFLAFVFLIGLFVMLYPLASRYYYRVRSIEQIDDFEQQRKNINLEDIERRMSLAKAYNASLNSNIVVDDPYTQKSYQDGRAEYARMLEVNEKIGHVEIPSINVDIPVYAGTNEDVLQKGAGHMEGTSLIVGGENTHTVITAHTGLPTAKLFTDLIKVKTGDIFYIHNLSETLAYRVESITKIEPSDFSRLTIENGRDIATLLTCTPIMLNTHRLLVRGYRVPYVKAEDEEVVQQSIKANKLIRILCISGAATSVIIISAIIFVKQKKKNNEQEEVLIEKNRKK